MFSGGADTRLENCPSTVNQHRGVGCFRDLFFCSVLFAEEDKNLKESKNCMEKDINTDPWPGYRYTGKLRPHYPLVRSRCPKKTCCYGNYGKHVSNTMAHS